MMCLVWQALSNPLSFPSNRVQNGRVFDSAVEMCLDKDEQPIFVVFHNRYLPFVCRIHHTASFASQDCLLACQH